MTYYNAEDSSPIHLLQNIWDNAQISTAHSWLKLNHALRAGLELAVTSGMKFELGDLKKISDRFRPGYWVGDYEWFYRAAVLYRNNSAWKEFEAYCGRKPFIIKGASITTHTGDGPCGGGLSRLIVGARFPWAGGAATVTSFNDKDGTLIACSYRRDGESKVCPACTHTISWPKDVLINRYTLTPADLKAAKRGAD